MNDPAIPALARPTVVFMVAVWRRDFIQRFLGLGLRSLLAPGNIPAVVRDCDCTFRFLTHQADEATFRTHPVFERLSQFCGTEFISIDDITFPGNYSTTLTLAFERGMRHSSEMMTRTYFVYLVADYVMADGSLANLVPHFRHGVSGITSGNFQIDEARAEDALSKRIDPETGVLSIAPRELVRFALDHLHPMVAANTLPNPISHSLTCNRLFWRADAESLVGRFYLRHMLCIRPETDDFVIGSSCDYSFIPELCPSGNVVTLDDSDEYCVVELQPRLHERKDIAPGPLTTTSLAAHLGRWTTAEHRGNAKTAVVFHAGDRTAAVNQTVQESGRFIEEVAALLPETAQPHRNHPYWRGALKAAHDYQNDYRRFGSRTTFMLPVVGRLSTPIHLRPSHFYLRYVYERCFTSNLSGYPWHPLWSDRRLVAPMLRRAIDTSTGPSLVLATGASWATNWLARNASPAWAFSTIAEFLDDDDTPSPGAAPFTHCLVFLRDEEVTELERIVPRLLSRVAEGSAISIVLTSDSSRSPGIDESLRLTAQNLLVPGLWCERVEFVRNRLRPYLMARWRDVLAGFVDRPGVTRVPRAGAAIAGLAAAVFIDNIACLLLPPKRGEATTVLITMSVRASTRAVFA